MLQDAGMAINPTDRRSQAQACLTAHALCPEPASFSAPIKSFHYTACRPSSNALKDQHTAWDDLHAEALAPFLAVMHHRQY